MTFLSVTPDEVWNATRVVATTGRQAARPAPPARALAGLLGLAVLTVPAAVAEAKWSKVGLVLTFAQHRCFASYGR